MSEMRNFVGDVEAAKQQKAAGAEREREKTFVDCFLTIQTHRKDDLTVEKEV